MLAKLSLAPGRAVRAKLLAAVVAAALALASGGYFFFSARQSAPEVTFIGLNGEKISSRSLLGKVVIVNFWSTSCAICINEMPEMVATYNRFNGRGLALIAVAMRGDPPNYVLNYVQSRKLPFTVALDIQGTWAKAFGNVQQTPTTIVIDREGKIIQRYIGAPEFTRLHHVLEQALAS